MTQPSPDTARPLKKQSAGTPNIDQGWVMLAHDVRNPLIGIERALQIALDPQSAQPSVQLLLTDALENCKAVLRLLEDMLETGHLSYSGCRTDSVNPLELVEECVRMLRFLAAKKSITVKVTDQSCMREVCLDGPRVMRIVLNLLHNALKHSGAGSIVEVAVRIDDERQLGISLLDYGKGIMPEDRDLVRVTSTRAATRWDLIERSTWGLYYCAIAVRSLGGNLWIESPPEGLNHGTKVGFTVPLTAIRGRSH